MNIPDPQDLHSVTDELNEAIFSYERELVGLNLGTRAAVELDSDTYIVLERDKDQFRLNIHLREGGTMHLTQTSRELRLRAIEKLPELENSLLESFGIEIKRVTDAKDEVLKMAERLNKLRTNE